MKLSDLFRNQTVARLLDCLLENPDQFFTISQLAKKAKVSLSVTLERIRELERLGIIKKIHSGKLRLYKLNTENRITKALLEFFGKIRYI